MFFTSEQQEKVKEALARSAAAFAVLRKKRFETLHAHEQKKTKRAHKDILEKIIKL